MSELFVIGLSWRRTPVSLREVVAFREEEIAEASREILALANVQEALLLSTCNRVEIHGVAPKGTVVAACAETRDFLIHSRKVTSASTADGIYEKHGLDAVTHIFRVASALDSLVVGETQILGQIKAAYGLSINNGTVGPILGRCEERAFLAAKRVRTETRIGEGAANISSVAVELAGHVFGDLLGKPVLVVGAGKMSALAVRHLRDKGATRIYVTNRSFEKAEALANEVDGVARPWEQLDELLSLCDVVISSTAAPVPIFTNEEMKKVMKKRRHRRMVIIDIAVPRDAEEKVGDLDGVYLFNMDDLEKIVANNLKERAGEAEYAEKIVKSEVIEFGHWLRAQAVVPTIRSLREHFQTVARLEVEKTLHAIKNEESVEARERAIRRLGDLIVNKLLHTPMVALKKDAGSEVNELVKAAEKLFLLSSEEVRKGSHENS